MLRQIEKVKTYLLYNQQEHLVEKLKQDKIKVIYHDKENKRVLVNVKNSILDIIV